MASDAARASSSEPENDRGQDAPLVSVVVPVLDLAERITACLDGLVAQTVPADDIEVIVVDNGSRDATLDVVRRYPVRLLVEGATRSPYAARNAGLAAARGQVVALTDATCAPASDWIERGLEALEAHKADLVGGEIRFNLGEPPTPGEIADAMTSIDVEASITAHRACMTGNLFVRSEVLEAIGPFDPSLRSGGDMRWTRRATDAGFLLVYAPGAVVSYPARRLGPLLRKQYRVGRGVPGVWSSFGMSRLQMLAATARGGLPMPPHRFVRQIPSSLGSVSRPRLVGAWFAIWLAKLARIAGCCRGMAGGQPGPFEARAG
jgi:cellulose synthase/poly-beta-1,6-N-acetylglucosamine synthase-like glycosyltransferase